MENFITKVRHYENQKYCKFAYFSDNKYGVDCISIILNPLIDIGVISPIIAQKCYDNYKIESLRNLLYKNNAMIEVLSPETPLKLGDITILKTPRNALHFGVITQMIHNKPYVTHATPSVNKVINVIFDFHMEKYLINILRIKWNKLDE